MNEIDPKLALNSLTLGMELPKDKFDTSVIADAPTKAEIARSKILEQFEKEKSLGTKVVDGMGFMSEKSGLTDNVLKPLGEWKESYDDFTSQKIVDLLGADNVDKLFQGNQQVQYGTVNDRIGDRMESLSAVEGALTNIPAFANYITAREAVGKTLSESTDDKLVNLIYNILMPGI